MSGGVKQSEVNKTLSNFALPGAGALGGDRTFAAVAYDACHAGKSGHRRPDYMKLTLSQWVAGSNPARLPLQQIDQKGKTVEREPGGFRYFATTHAQRSKRS